jgi:hypothetical protein
MNLIRKLRPIVPRDGEKEKGFASEKVSKMPLFQGAYEKPPALLGFIIPFQAEMSTPFAFSPQKALLTKGGDIW